MARVDTDKGWHRHGYVPRPQSRAFWCAEDHGRGCGDISSEPQSVEQAKGWPDAPGSPPDGMIASGGHRRFAALDGLTTPSGDAWPATRVRPGQLFKIEWFLTAQHKTSRWQGFCTRQGWDQTRPLERAAFDLTPFLDLTWPCPQGGWSCQMPVKDVVHWSYLPEDRRGRHVLYLIWTVGDTGAAFYQACDVDFG